MRDVFSFFRSVADRNPAKVHKTDLALKIANDIWVKEMTKMSRDARAKGDVSLANHYKKACGAFVASAICEGGHRQEHVVAYTQHEMNDTDGIPKDMIVECMNRVSHDPHTMLAHITNSLEGMRVIYKCEFTDENGNLIPDDFFVWDRNKETQKQFLERIMPYHQAAYQTGNEYYSELMGMPYDKQTKDITRLSLLANDPNVYFVPFVKEFRITADEVDKFRRKMPSQSNALCPTPAESSVHMSNKFNNVFDLIEAWVSHTTQYVSGTWNRYVMRCGYLLVEFGIDENVASDWAVARFSDYRSNDVRSIIKSCYRRAQFGIRTFFANNSFNNSKTK